MVLWLTRRRDVISGILDPASRRRNPFLMIVAYRTPLWRTTISEVRQRASVSPSRKTPLGNRLGGEGSDSTRDAGIETAAEITTLQGTIRERPDPSPTPKKR